MVKPVQDAHVHVQRERALLDEPMSTVGDVAMGLEVTFLNSAVDSVGKLAGRQSLEAGLSRSSLCTKVVHAAAPKYKL